MCFCHRSGAICRYFWVYIRRTEKQTTPTRRSSSAHAKEETRQTKDPPDPDGIGVGLSQHFSASVFSSQTIDLQFLGGTGPSQQTESGPVALKKDHAPSDEHPHHEQHPTINAHQPSDGRVSRKCQQQFQGTTARTSHLTGRSMVGHVDVPDCTGSRTEQWRQRDGSSDHSHSIYHDVLDITGQYRRVSFNTKEYHVKLEEIMSAKQPVTSGNLFWKRLMQDVHNKSMQQLMYEQKYAWTHERDERPQCHREKELDAHHHLERRCPNFACCP